MKSPKFCNECRWSEPNKQYSQLLVCVHRRVTGADTKSVVSIYPSKECYEERIGYWNPCGKPGRLFEYGRKQVWSTQPTATSAVTSAGVKEAITAKLTYWNAGCTDPDNCRLCKAAKSPGTILTSLWHAGIPSVKREVNERTRKDN